ncbi:helix-hairpin-helix domain-containing protein [Bacillus testis]
MFDALGQVHQEAIDPCVEDQLRCVVHYAFNPDSTKT